MRKWVWALSLALLVPLVGLGQAFWTKKEFQQWSAKECSKLLSDSPWAKGKIISAVFIQPLGQASAVPGREMNPQLEYVAQLWSALPIRQAAIQQARLEPGHRKLSEKERQAIEERQTRLLKADFPDRIIVRVEYSTNVPSYEQEFARYWQKRLQGEWKQDTFLNTASGKYAPVEVRVAGGAGGEFEIAFPRQANGQPLIRPADKFFSIEFPSPTIGQLAGQRIFLEFKLKDMLISDQPVF